MSRRKKYKIPNWQHNPKKDTSKDTSFIQIHHDLLLNQSFMSLKPQSKVVYVYMRDYSNGERDFTFPYSIHKKIVAKGTFKTAVKELCDKGFIEIIENGKNTRTPNKYRFSIDWYKND